MAVYPESTHSSFSSPINTLLKTKLREHALILRALHKSLHADASLSAAAILSTLRAKKEELMKEVYTIMSAIAVPREIVRRPLFHSSSRSLPSTIWRIFSLPRFRRTLLSSSVPCALALWYAAGMTRAVGVRLARVPQDDDAQSVKDAGEVRRARGDMKAIRVKMGTH